MDYADAVMRFQDEVGRSVSCAENNGLTSSEIISELERIIAEIESEAAEAGSV